MHSQETPGKTTVTQVWKEAILPYLGTRLVILIVGLFATYYIMPLLVHISSLPDPASKMALPQALWLQTTKPFLYGLAI